MAQRKRFLLRIDPRLHEALERWAADDLRSVNAQIEYLLKGAVERAGRSRPDRGPPDAAGTGAGSDGAADEDTPG